MTENESSYELRYPRYAEALYLALEEDPFYRRMAESVSPDTPKEASIRYLDFSIREAERYGIVDFGDSRVGVAVWSKPLDADSARRKKKEKHAFLLEHMGAASERVYADSVAFMSERSSTMVEERSWYLSIVGVLPEHQNQGLGARLVRGVLERSDSAGLPTYLETFTPRNEPFYERLGYRVRGRFHEPTVDAEYALMVREAGT